MTLGAWAIYISLFLSDDEEVVYRGRLYKQKTAEAPKPLLYILNTPAHWQMWLA